MKIAHGATQKALTNVSIHPRLFHAKLSGGCQGWTGRQDFCPRREKPSWTLKCETKTLPAPLCAPHHPTHIFNLEDWATEQSSQPLWVSPVSRSQPSQVRTCSGLNSEHADSTDDRKQRHVHVYDGAVPWLNSSSVPAAPAKSNQGSESAQPACYKFTD